MILSPVPPVMNTTDTHQVNADPLIMFGIPGIIIGVSSAGVLLVMMYRYYNSKRHVLPRFEPVMVRTSTPPQDSV